MFYNKYGHPGGIGLYGPGKIKISKEKPISASSRGPHRWNKSPSTSKNSRGKGKMMSNFHNRKMSSNLDEIRKVNNFMNNSHQKDDASPVREEQDNHRAGSRDRKHHKKSNSKLSSFNGSDKNSALKELLQLKDQANKPKSYGATKSAKEIIDSEKVKNGAKGGSAFHNRKFSAPATKSDNLGLKDPKPSNRSRKSHSSRPTERGSRADSRDTAHSKHEDSKTSYQNDKPANIQAPDTDKDSLYVDENSNIVTKFAFATRVGYIPNNPYKVNQDAYVLAPNIMKLPAFHYFGVCDGHGQNGKEVSGYVKQRLPVLLESFIKSTGDDKKALAESFVTVNTELDYVPFDCQFSGTTCCTVLFKGNHIISANAGDSRAIVVRN